MFRLVFRKVRGFVTTTILRLFKPPELLDSERIALEGYGLHIPACVLPRAKIFRGEKSPQITKIEWCKRTCRPYHEFIIAYGDDTVMWIERNVYFSSESRKPLEIVVPDEEVPKDERATVDCSPAELYRYGYESKFVTPEPATNTPSSTESPGLSNDKILPEIANTPGVGSPAHDAEKHDANGLDCTHPKPHRVKKVQTKSSSPSLPRPKASLGGSAPASLHSVSNSLNSFQPTDCDDKLILTKNTKFIEKDRRKQPYDVMFTLKLRSSFTEVQLAILVYVMHRYAPAYKLLEYQSYWFAMMIYKYFKEVLQGVKEKVNKATTLKVGTFEHLPVPKGTANSLDKITAEFDIEWARFSDKLAAAQMEAEELEPKKTLEDEERSQAVERAEKNAKEEKAVMAATEERLKEEVAARERSEREAKELRALLASSTQYTTPNGA